MLTKFSEVTEGVNDLALCIFALLDEEDAHAVIDPLRVQALAKGGTRISRVLSPFMLRISRSNATLETVLLPAMQCLVLSILLDWIFPPFCPLQSEFNKAELYDGLLRICGVIAAQGAKPPSVLRSYLTRLQNHRRNSDDGEAWPIERCDSP